VLHEAITLPAVRWFGVARTRTANRTGRRVSPFATAIEVIPETDWLPITCQRVPCPPSATAAAAATAAIVLTTRFYSTGARGTSR
jgi:hypothetical protein